MERRAFVAGMAGMMAVPLGADAQQPRMYRLGVVLQGGTYSQAVAGLQDGLRELGFEEKKQFVLQVRDAQGDLKLVEAAARDLERQNVDLSTPWPPRSLLWSSGLQRTFRSCSPPGLIRWRPASSRTSGSPGADSRARTANLQTLVPSVWSF